MRLLEKLSVVAKQRGLAGSTIDCYSLWVMQFLRFSAAAHHQWKHPSELGTADVEAFLNDMVVNRKLAGSTQNQALNALVFLYKHVLDAIPSGQGEVGGDGVGGVDGLVSLPVGELAAGFFEDGEHGAQAERCR